MPTPPLPEMTCGFLIQLYSDECTPSLKKILDPPLELWGKLTHRRCVRTETLIVDVIVRFVLETG